MDLPSSQLLCPFRSKECAVGLLLGLTHWPLCLAGILLWSGPSEQFCLRSEPFSLLKFLLEHTSQKCGSKVFFVAWHGFDKSSSHEEFIFVLCLGELRFIRTELLAVLAALSLSDRSSVAFPSRSSFFRHSSKPHRLSYLLCYDFYFVPPFCFLEFSLLGL